MLPFLTQPAVAPACYVPSEKVAASLLFGAAQYLSRTFAAAPVDKKRGTISLWCRRATLGVTQWLFAGYDGSSSAHFRLLFDASDRLYFEFGGAATIGLTTNAVYRDPAAWLHVVLRWDTTQAVAAQRVRLEVNGVEVTNWAAAAYPAQNAEAQWALGNGNNRLGVQYDGVIGRFSGSMAAVLSVDGRALPSSAFGTFNIHGIWVPRACSETYAAIVAAGGWGVNSCHLDFSDPLQPGKDVSGWGNHWTATGFDSTGKDTVASTPTNVYATWSSLNLASGSAVSDGGLLWTAPTGGLFGTALATMAIPPTGKWYAEMVWLGGTGGTNSIGCGIAAGSTPPDGYAAGKVLRMYRPEGTRWRTGEPAAGYGAAWGIGSVIGVAVDMDAGTIEFHLNGVAQGVAFSDLAGTAWTWSAHDDDQGAPQWRINCGQRAWVYAPPVGYSALCTDNLPEPDIKDPAEAFVQVTATGADLPAVLDAASAHWAGARHVEIVKRRDASEDWRWRFSDDPANAIASNNADAKAAAPALAAAGAYVGTRLRIGRRYGVWTGEVVHTTGTATTIAHGLGTARNWVLATRVSVGGGDRYVWHPDLPAGRLLKLNATDYFTDATLTAFGADSFQIGATAPSGSYRVLVLAERSGFIHLGKYNGNSSSDGAFASCDVSPDFFLTKEFTVSGSNSGWFLALAALTGGANPAKCLFPNWGTWTESTAYPMDLTVGGVKLRYADGDPNQSGRSYVTIAIGRPIGGVCVAPATAR